MAVPGRLLSRALLLAAASTVWADVPSPPPDAYQVGYAPNLLIGDSVVNLTNAGTRNGFDPNGGICVNIYTFDPSEELVNCCSCYVSPNGLQSISMKNDIIKNLLIPIAPAGVVIKLLASQPSGASSSTCNPSSPSSTTLEPGMRAWVTAIHQNTATSAYDMAENAFRNAILSDSELQKLTTFCAFVLANGSSFGLCKSCRLGGTLGGTVK